MGLEDDPFGWRVTKDGCVRVTRGGRQVVVVAGAQARRLSAELDVATEREAQQLLARATGNYRRGNEKGAARP